MEKQNNMHVTTQACFLEFDVNSLESEQNGAHRPPDFKEYLYSYCSVCQTVFTSQGDHSCFVGLCL